MVFDIAEALTRSMALSVWVFLFLGLLLLVGLGKGSRQLILPINDDTYCAEMLEQFFQSCVDVSHSQSGSFVRTAG